MQNLPLPPSLCEETEIQDVVHFSSSQFDQFPVIRPTFPHSLPDTYVYDSNAEKTQCRVHKKRYLASPFPRIVKRDIRRCFPQMMVNIINDGSVQLLRSFFQTFCAPKLPYEEYLQMPETSGALQKQQFPNAFDGQDALMIGVVFSHLLSPDCTGTLAGARICQRKQSVDSVSEIECELEMDFIYRGTRLYDFAPVMPELSEFPIQTATSSDFRPSPHAFSSPVVDIERAVGAWERVLLSDPVSWSSRRRVTLSLDSHRRICSVTAVELNPHASPPTPSCTTDEGGSVPLSLYISQALHCASLTMVTSPLASAGPV